MEQTTDEIMDKFKTVEVDPELSKGLNAALQLADLAKFAKVQPLPDENQRVLDFAFQFVKGTMEIKKTLAEIPDSEKTGEL